MSNATRQMSQEPSKRKRRRRALPSNHRSSRHHPPMVKRRWGPEDRLVPRMPVIGSKGPPDERPVGRCGSIHPKAVNGRLVPDSCCGSRTMTTEVYGPGDKNHEKIAARKRTRHSRLGAKEWKA